MLIRAHPLRKQLQMLGNERVAPRVEKHGKAPRVAKRYEMCLSWIKVHEKRPRARAQLPHPRELIDPSSQRRVQQVCPDEEASPVAPYLKVGKQTFDNVRFGAEEVDGVHVGVKLATGFDQLDGYRRRRVSK